MTQAERAKLSGLRIAFFGLGGSFSRLPLEALLRAGVNLRAVVEPAGSGETDGYPFMQVRASSWATSGAARRGLPMAGGGTGRGLRQIAAAADAPVYRVSRLSDARTIGALAACELDAFCVSCFTRRLPPALLALPRLGALNAHPSFLPANRGPDPLFWTFHSGVRETGVTVHLMDAALDSGAILAQAHEVVGEGETEGALEARLAMRAGALFIEALAGLRDGTLVPAPQDQTRASYYSWPEAGDYLIPATWDARRAWAFARGVIGRGQPMTLIARDGTRFLLIEPLGYTSGEPRAGAWRLDGDRLEMACADGVLVSRAERLG
ncbi:MAG TPA: formyltransferase family protein [Ktedonobacterales bacterium]